jgi:hypothetical protein
MFVVIWEPRTGLGGGHQLVLGGEHKADYLRRALSKALPDHAVRIESAEAHSASAVLDRAERRQRQSRSRA